MSKQNNGSTQNNDTAQPNAELVAAKERIAVLEKEQEGLQGLVSAGNAELLAAKERITELQESGQAFATAVQERIKTLEAQLEEAAANGGDEALIQENTELKADNEKLKAALDGGDTRDGGKEARGESIPNFLGDYRSRVLLANICPGDWAPTGRCSAFDYDGISLCGYRKRTNAWKTRRDRRKWGGVKPIFDSRENVNYYLQLPVNYPRFFS